MTKQQQYMKNLNTDQKDAVLHANGPLLVLAGAGTGKTKVISHRFAYMTGVLKVPPTSILTMTFTNKAANEMKERIERLTGKNTDGLWIGTFHSLSARILRRDIGKLGYESDFCIYDDGDSGHIVRTILKEFKIHEALYRGIFSKISSLKASLVEPDDLLSNEESYGFDEKFARVYVRYQDELKKNNALDFNDLIMLTVKLFEKHPSVLKMYQKEFSHIMIDEFQDTNISQYRLARLLCDKHKNICVVGDDDQSIYKFRGANVGNIRNFKKDFPKVKVINLGQNYRSTQNILNVAGNIITKNTKRMPKELWTERKKGQSVFYCTTINEKEEARYISQAIKELYLKGKYSYGDIGIFYRVNQQSKAIEEVLRENGQHYSILGGANYYHKKEVKDVVSYLKAIANPHDSVSLKSIINCPPRQIGAATVTRVENEARKRDESLYATMKHIIKSNGYTASLKDKVSSFVNIIDDLIAKKRINLQDFLELIYKKTGYLKWIGDEKAKNLDSLMDAAEGKDLSGFVDIAALYSSADETYNNDVVSLMTLHNAKGLEFPVVFIAGIEDGLIPHFHAIKDPEELEEERRLFYVGVTRAQDMLIMSGTKKRKLYTSVQDQQPSRFLSEIPANCYKCIEKRPRADAIASSNVKVPAGRLNKSPFVTGARVKHPKWGVGVVRDTYGETDDVKVTVNFPSVGMKRLSLKFANLEKI
ncbi:ATP-dependent DNA helicase PcrA [bacterium BMS3Abin09]|nr:ATP-dependent DNA helicase PcrA [bacterium BMS3Abin09]